MLNNNIVTAVIGDIIYLLIEHAVYHVTTKAHPCHITICKCTLIIKQAARPHMEGNGESLCQIKNIVTAVTGDIMYLLIEHAVYDVTTRAHPCHITICKCTLIIKQDVAGSQTPH